MISTIYHLVIRTGLFLSAAFFISFTSAWAISSVERNSFTNNLGFRYRFSSGDRWNFHRRHRCHW